MKILIAAVVLAIVAAALVGSMSFADRSLPIAVTTLLAGLAASMLVLYAAARGR